VSGHETELSAKTIFLLMGRNCQLPTASKYIFSIKSREATAYE
jgi:hypothetical protein